MKIQRIVGFALLVALCQSLLAQQPASDPKAQRAAVEAELKAAIREVQRIVNQPVTQLKQTPGMRFSEFTEGWFHEGATKPDFNNVDVRATRDTATYAKNQYVTSNLNPGVVFLGAELEFNSMTKYFYTDYSIPKKKLSEAEMLEINRLYRVIGKCQKQLATL